MKSARGARVSLLALGSLLGACGFNPAGEADGGGNNVDAEVAIDAADTDGTSVDVDAAMIDAATIDAATIDAATIDAAAIDAAMIDAAMIDAAIDASTTGDVVHIADDSIGTGDLVVSAPITTVTSSTGFTFGMPLPSGVTYTTSPQDGGGPDLAVLRVRTLTINANVRVTGSRPLIILANSIAVNAVIDAGARHSTPGAGGNATGPGVGAIGEHMGTYGDSGGGGGSFGAAGGAGGNATCASGCNPDMTVNGGATGPAYGDAAVTRLQGGSGGGATYFPAGSQCSAGAPGAGGGGIQLYAATSITIAAAGGINVGGGGGSGGDMCNNPYNWLAGHGGGSGGAIYLQSPVVQNAGTLAANGGGGGGGAGSNGNGMSGGDGALGTTAAGGGNGNGSFSAGGGDGAVTSGTGQVGSTAGNDGNGGGGGGGLGRIHVRYRTSYIAGTQTPAATTSMY